MRRPAFLSGGVKHSGYQGLPFKKSPRRDAPFSEPQPGPIVSTVCPSVGWLELTSRLKGLLLPILQGRVMLPGIYGNGGQEVTLGREVTCTYRSRELDQNVSPNPIGELFFPWALLPTPGLLH
jgi:hypothetical protein